MKTTHSIRNSFLLALAALIWGVAFVAQSEGGRLVGPFTFSAIRCLIGSAILIPAMMLFDKLKITRRKPITIEDKKILWIAGVLSGVSLFFACNFQQLALFLGASAGKAGFLTACYIVFVPIIGIFLGRRCGINIWIAVLLVLGGLYFLCMSESFGFKVSDLLMLGSALFFAIQILIIDKYTSKVDGVRMSCIQFLVMGVMSIALMFFFDMKGNIANISEVMDSLNNIDAWINILYAGILSCGVAYTIQIIAQNGLNPTVASLIMCLESVFSLFAGAVLLGQYMTKKELIGCALVFAGIILSQIPRKADKAKASEE